MATATICSQFDITILGNADLNVAKSFTATRAFIIVGITATNDAAAASTLTVTNTTSGNDITGTTAAPPAAGTGIVQAQAVAGPESSVTVIAANAGVADGDVVTIVAGAATVSKAVLHCIGNPSQAIPIA